MWGRREDRLALWGTPDVISGKRGREENSVSSSRGEGKMGTFSIIVAWGERIFGTFGIGQKKKGGGEESIMGRKEKGGER